MSYAFPPDVEKLVQEQMAGSQYSSEDDLLRDALHVFRTYQAKRAQLIADVQVGINESDQGLARPLDIDSFLDECFQELEDEEDASE